ncbi:MAG: hypothetical protein K2N34_12415 [Lachnospiraceae bacterium]|nr:hypothetical protein [Lachnospiraceae bacterium]
MIGIVIFTSSIVLMISYLVWFCFGQQKMSTVRSVIVNGIMLMLSIAAFAGGITVYSMHPIQNDIGPESQTEVQTDVLQPQEDESGSEFEYVPDELQNEKDMQKNTTNVSESGKETMQIEPSTSEAQDDAENVQLEKTEQRQHKHRQLNQKLYRQNLD